MYHLRTVVRSIAVILFALTSVVVAQDPPSSAVVFENVRVFDGTRGQLSGPVNVLVVGNVIKTISNASVAAPPGTTVVRVPGGGRTLMPGLIDNHWHTMMVSVSPAQMVEGDAGYSTLLAAVQAKATLLRGFTTVRDMGGPSFALKRAIDEGRVPGPRIYPSGAIITITGGHGDFRSPTELPRSLGAPLSRMELLNGSMVADSPDEVRRRTREQLLLGASQIKLTAGGGVASPHSPLDASTFNEDELRAAVQAAENWNTYVTVHAYMPAAIQRSIAAGVKVIEHGHLMDDATAEMMAAKGIWLSFQPFLEDEGASPVPPDSRSRQLQVFAGTEKTMALAKKYRLKVAFGTDILFSEEVATRQGAELAKMRKWYSPPEVLAMATSTNAQLLKLSGPRNPYPGNLGVVAEGALADLLLVDGDPIANIDLIAQPEKSFVVIMKDGKIYKNILNAD
jgi:imidazolonepropionase-like amidohydrolase